jgi:hypothetical protein
VGSRSGRVGTRGRRAPLRGKDGEVENRPSAATAVATWHPHSCHHRYLPNPSKKRRTTPTTTVANVVHHGLLRRLSDPSPPCCWRLWPLPAPDPGEKRRRWGAMGERGRRGCAARSTTGEMEGRWRRRRAGRERVAAGKRRARH